MLHGYSSRTIGSFSSTAGPLVNVAVIRSSEDAPVSRDRIREKGNEKTRTGASIDRNGHMRDVLCYITHRYCISDQTNTNDMLE